MSTFDGATVTERLRIMAASGAGIQVTGTLNGHTIPGGAGTLALTSDITGISNVVEDTTPQLGGTLDANGNTIDMGTNIITDTKVGQWDTAYGWGNHGSENYVRDNQQTYVDNMLNTPSAGQGIGKILSWTGGNYAWVDDQKLTNADVDARAQLKIDALVDSAPGTLDTLNELAAALGDDANFSTTVTNSIATKLALAGGTMSGDIDGAGYKGLFANMYSTLADLPSATTYHGMFAHVHATGAGYFAHGGNWIRLANYTDLPSVPTAVSSFSNDAGYLTSVDAGVNTHLNTNSATSGQILSWNGTDYAWVADQTGGGSSNAISQLNSNVTVTDTGTNGTIIFDTDGTDRWSFTSAGHLIPYANASYDIGNASNKEELKQLKRKSCNLGEVYGIEFFSLNIVNVKRVFASIVLLSLIHI